MRTILWIGPAFTIAEALTTPALAPAASRWQEGLLTALAREGVAITIVTHRAERIWPYGSPWIKGSKGSFHGIPRESVPFANLPTIREPILTQAYRAAIDRMCKAGDKPDLVVSYNVWGPVAAACRHASDAHGVPWIPFLLDHDRPTENWANVKSGIRGASGVAFVSQWAFERAPVARKLHLDAGVVSVPDVPPTRSRSRILLYTGALHQWGGIETLLDSLPLLATPGVTLVVVGRGGSKHLHHRLATTPGVEYHGGVDEPTLQRLTQQAEVLANPRPHGVQGNEMNFPSKLLHYLTSLKPVATTLTPGVAPSYRDVVIAADDDSPAAFAAAVDRSFALDDAEWKALVGRIRSFLSEGKLWSHQAQRFITWADEMLVDQRAGAIATTSRP